MKKGILIFTIFIVFSFSLSGCWDYMEYENMVQVIGIGIDYNVETNDFTVTHQYISTAKQGQSTSGESSKASTSGKGVVHSATGKTIMEILPKLEQAVFKRMFYEYTKVIVIGNDMAKYKLGDLIEFYDRTPAIRSTTYIAIAPGRAEDAISSVDESRDLPSAEEIFDLINQSAKTGTSYPVTLQEFDEMLAVGGWEATAPYIVNIKNKEEPKSLGAEDEDIRYDEEIVGDIRLKGTAAFKRDKFAGWLNLKESRGFKFITGKKANTYISSLISENTDYEEILYFLIDNVKSTIKPRVKNGKPSIDLDVKITANLRKYSNISNSEILSPEEMDNLSISLEEAIKSDIEASLAKCQGELNSDIFGFGFAFFRKYTKLWQSTYEKKWDDIFPQLPVNVKVNVKLINSGTNLRKFIIK